MVHRRAKPLLGTLVSISTPQADEACFTRASDVAFARIAAIHEAMSFHEAGSDLRVLARARRGDIVRVNPDTQAVLRMALQLEAASAGAFNACCAQTLVMRRVLPEPMDAAPPAAATLAEGIELLDDARVLVHATAWIDLGGIAKGYAVDAAVDELLQAGLCSGVVNAGGDLRAFGPRQNTVHVRDPRRSRQTLASVEIADLACATSAPSPAGHGTDHWVRIARSVGENAPMSVTVFAPACALADGLTKVVWSLGARAAALLHEHAASALVLSADGRLVRL
jgi:thiamine biosynthesis lipoprotein